MIELDAKSFYVQTPGVYEPDHGGLESLAGQTISMEANLIWLDPAWMAEMWMLEVMSAATRYARRSLPAPPPEKPDTATPTEPE